MLMPPDDRAFDRPPPPSRVAFAVAAATALLAIAVPPIVIATVKVSPAPARARIGPAKIVSKADLPPVEPLAFQEVSPDDARAFNATIPFSTAANPAARPFRAPETGDDLARATDCLATAMVFEAGDDAEGQRAVAQVVLNRVRHPAFPKSICGVVFQGSERRTGCQFTFACDGALVRHSWSADAWDRARKAAATAIGGKVYAPVGHATHYHTNWVVPYWSSSLDKINAVGTHLFFRWTGWWGTPPAFNRQVESSEPVIPALAALFPEHGGDTAAEFGLAGVAPGLLPLPKPTALDPDAFIVTLDPSVPADSYRPYAEAACGARAYCKVLLWTTKAQTPTALPLDTMQVASMAFSYLRDTVRGHDKALWNCAQIKRIDPAECMKVQSLRPSRLDDASTLLYERPELLAPTPKLIAPPAQLKEPNGPARLIEPGRAPPQPAAKPIPLTPPAKPGE